MSLDQAPEPTLKVMKGMLETSEAAWMLATSPDSRKELNEKFKALAEEIKREHGQEGEVVARHMRMRRPR